MLSCEFWEISKNTFSYKTPLVPVSEEVSIVIFNSPLNETNEDVPLNSCSIKQVLMP